MEHLLFHLSGPFAAWGGIAVGETRETLERPSRSSILGLVAAALGIRRDDPGEMRALAEGLGTAVNLHGAGGLLRDYHTTQVPPAVRGVRHRTRRDELAGSRYGLKTILSRRDYRLQASATVACWKTGETGPDLATIQGALRRPRFVLYLGRKSCPPSLPLDPHIIDADDLVSAFDGYDAKKTWPITPHRRDRVFWDSRHRNPGIPQANWETTRRRDEPNVRFDRTFEERDEHHAVKPSPEVTS